MTTVAATADLLDKAAQIIETNGWYQDDFYDYAQAQQEQKQPRECRVCAYGALNIVVTGRPGAPSFDDDEEWIESAAYAVIGVKGIEGHDLYAWNDAEGRTAQEVIDAMRTTAAALRKRVAA